jgi:ribose/xylose/arabinose/galactoside ABC-type transport system permease subunit
MKKETSIERFIRSKIFTLVVMLAVLVVVFTVATEGTFLKFANIKMILNVIVIVVFLAIGEGFLIIYGNIDLSVGAIGTLAGCIMGVVMTNWGLPWYLGFLGAFIIGTLCGFLNAAMVNKLNFQPFIATLAMKSIAGSLAYVVTKGIRIPLEDNVLEFIGTKKVFGDILPVNVLIALVFILVYGIILSRTRFGRQIYLCGGNMKAAKLTGINPKRVSYILFMNAGFLAALAGIIYSARLENATPTGISNQQFAGITAAIMGGISFGGGSGGMLGCFLGLLVLNTFNNGMTCIGVNTYIQTIFSGLLLVVALMLDYVSQHSQSKRLVKISAAASEKTAAGSEVK